MINDNYKCQVKNTVLSIVPLVFDKNISLLEQICELINKQKEIIAQVNQNTTDLSNIDITFNSLQSQIDVLKSQITKIQNEFVIFEAQINTSVDNKNQALYSQVVNLLNDYQSIFNNNLNNLRIELEDEIKRIELGNVKAYDPTTGKYVNVSTAILNVYDALRNNSISAIEFDNLELTATVFDSKEITAFNFDINGKTLLTQ